MADIILKMALQSGGEAEAFGEYLFDFMERRTRRLTGRAALDAYAPSIMVRGDPASGDSAKVLIFQEDRLARVFSAGWEKRRSQPRSFSPKHVESIDDLSLFDSSPTMAKLGLNEGPIASFTAGETVGAQG